MHNVYGKRDLMSETETRRCYKIYEMRPRHFKNRSQDRDVETETISLVWGVITLLCSLKLHVINFILAFLAKSSDKSPWTVVTNVHFLRQMAFRGEINYQFRKSALDLLSVIHYNYWCISPNCKVIWHFQTFSFWLEFPYKSSFWGFRTHESKF